MRGILLLVFLLLATVTAPNAAAQPAHTEVVSAMGLGGGNDLSMMSMVVGLVLGSSSALGAIAWHEHGRRDRP